jgi:hypothetical protein
VRSDQVLGLAAIRFGDCYYLGCEEHVLRPSAGEIDCRSALRTFAKWYLLGTIGDAFRGENATASDPWIAAKTELKASVEMVLVVVATVELGPAETVQDRLRALRGSLAEGAAEYFAG